MNHKMLFDKKERKWEDASGDVEAWGEVDVIVRCSCGEEWVIYVQDVPYECLCGRVYQATVNVMREVC